VAVIAPGNGVFNSIGLSLVLFQGTALFLSSFHLSGQATVNFNGVGLGSASPAEWISVGQATVDFQGIDGAVASPGDWHSDGTSTVSFVTGAILSASIFNSAGRSVVAFFGVDDNAPIGIPGNLFVPVRYILSGETANVVPVQTVLVGGIDIVPVREFVGPDNVVPVREVTTEVPRVKVVKV
jgi:hypothetical protein